MAEQNPSEGSLDPAAIDELLRQAAMFTDAAGAPAAPGTESAGAAPSAEPSPQAAADPASSAFAGGPDQSAIDELLRQATFEDPATASTSDTSGADAVFAAAGFGAPAGSADAPSAIAGDPFSLPNFSQVIQDAQVSSIDLLRDVELNVKIELGRSRMLVEDVLRLAEGSVVELDKLAGDPVDVFVNDRLVARGEVLVLNDNFCVRVNEIVAGAKDEGL